MTKLQCRLKAHRKKGNLSKLILILVIMLMLALTARNVTAILVNGNGNPSQGNGMSITVLPASEAAPDGEKAEPQFQALESSVEKDDPADESKEGDLLDDSSNTKTVFTANPYSPAVKSLSVANQFTLISNVLTASITVSILEAEVEIDPDTINLRAPREWITAYIHLEGYQLQDEDWETVQFIYQGENVAADWGEVQNDGKLVVKFSGQKVADILDVGEDIEIFITGKVNDILYNGSDIITVIDPTPPGRPPGPGPGPGPPAAPRPPLLVAELPDNVEPSVPIEEIVVEPDPPAVTPKQIVIMMQIDSDEAYVNSKRYQLDAVPYIKPTVHRALAPVRFISEKLGAQVHWLPETKQVRIVSEDKEILITTGSDTAMVNGEPVHIDCPAEILNSRTFTPLRFVSETLGATVYWNAKTKTITIVK